MSWLKCSSRLVSSWLLNLYFLWLFWSVFTLHYRIFRCSKILFVHYILYNSLKYFLFYPPGRQMFQSHEISILAFLNSIMMFDRYYGKYHHYQNRLSSIFFHLCNPMIVKVWVSVKYHHYINLDYLRVRFKWWRFASHFGILQAIQI